jgi:hypothetical protein
VSSIPRIRRGEKDFFIKKFFLPVFGPLFSAPAKGAPEGDFGEPNIWGPIATKIVDIVDKK